MSFPVTIVHPSGARLTLVPNQVLVKLPVSPTATVADALKELGLVPLTGNADVPTADGNAVPARTINNSANLVFAQTADGAEFQAPTETQQVSPVYVTQFAGTIEYLSLKPDTVVLPAAVVSDPDRADVLREFGLVRDDVRSEYLGACDVLTIESGHPSFEIRDQLSTALGTEVKLEFVPVVVPTAMTPNDPLFGQQWDMVRINAGGAGSTGWNLNRGSSSVTIAILDEGVDLNHPDLTGQFLHNGINLGTMSGTGAPTGNHGTPCAGIAAAPIDNTIGTCGVAGGCRILPIAFATWSDVEVAAGIRYARAQGARVISMSFGWDLWDHAIIDPAIAEAHAAGLVMAVATHNHNRADGITYPATNPLVIAVGASDQADNRKSPTSPDGETWGSNFGDQISVVAPGVLCPAPDRVGANGYTNADYTMTFNGTSAATPHVAGLAALLFSRKSSLTNVQVRDIIEKTAAKMGTVPYATTSGHPNGTWNNQMGYGRIDVLGALQAVPVFEKPWRFEYEMLEKWTTRELDEIAKRVVELDKTFKEIDWVKRAAREDPDFRFEDGLRDPVIKEINVRLDQLEKNVQRIGAAFIEPNSRPSL